ncbi:phosphoribosylaminoimidazolesuccinocarboxamide synthase [Shewanella sp. NIFS-20-20]|uniref:phosphoribosylaminoimidazolesuccinocarboxamide synthase n=1 Tax=Shewanella sp. NIFS-20-20 TaxID=2853806 RepID=UPI001C480ED4|nr:phosphoribosylaminoimidazolesuccinocarboxamide synthase [Shewanella sp. NIFS-20-20]MBV7317468.1 phosphoribosylaminoimidazolesuccinocarboxamide synthase [Shewanella sp. NIFS-20-20]
MRLAETVLAVNNDLPIRTDQTVHSGKVRSVYWLTAADSARLIAQKGYDVPADTPLAIMVISDRISAFDCIFHGEQGLQGIPGKGAALNAIANHWFSLFAKKGLADCHILDVPHPLVWIVQKAQPIKVEAIIRNYITGSMWRAYEKGEREFCGIRLPEGLQKDQKLPELLITPSTKGILSGIPGVPEQDDVNVSRADLEANYLAFGFKQPEHIDVYEILLKQGFEVIRAELEKLDQIFVDTKFEFGYVTDKMGDPKLIYMDEVGTPDSSRIWDGAAYRDGHIVENSKEGFRQMLLTSFPDPDILLNKHRMSEREAFARDTELALETMLATSKTYTSIAEKIIGQPLTLSNNPRAEIINVLRQEYDLIDG